MLLIVPGEPLRRTPAVQAPAYHQHPASGTQHLGTPTVPQITTMTVPICSEMPGSRACSWKRRVTDSGMTPFSEPPSQESTRRAKEMQPIKLETQPAAPAMWGRESRRVVALTNFHLLRDGMGRPHQIFWKALSTGRSLPGRLCIQHLRRLASCTRPWPYLKGCCRCSSTIP